MLQQGMGTLAVGAEAAHQALGQDAGVGIGNEVAFNAHVQKAGDAGSSVVGM